MYSMDTPLGSYGTTVSRDLEKEGGFGVPIK
jgi:hypothetical protein